jgi:hypothetical protein
MLGSFSFYGDMSQEQEQGIKGIDFRIPARTAGFLV